MEFTVVDPFFRLHGDLIYIDVMTLEGNKYCITGNSKSFYVNSSNGSILDPRPSKQALEDSTLVGLLQKISAKFKKGFQLLSNISLLCQMTTLKFL
jgi:protein TIF31